MDEKKLTIQEYIEKTGVSQATVYRHIKTGKLESEKVDGALYIIIKDDKNETHIDNGLLDQIKSENEYLRQQLIQAMETIKQMQNDSESAKQRSDTIILQLTRELEGQKMLIEHRNESFWKRLFRGKKNSTSDGGEV